MIDVEKDGLRAFEEDALAGSMCRVELAPTRASVGQDLGCNFAECIDECPGIDLASAISSPKSIMVGEQAFNLSRERGGIFKIDHAERAPSHFVLIGGTDAAFGCSDALDAVRGLAKHVKLA